MNTTLIPLGVAILFALMFVMALLFASRRQPQTEYRFCAWCKLWYDREGKRSALIPLNANAVPGHGMCSECAKDQVAGIRKLKELQASEIRRMQEESRAINGSF